MSLSWRWTSGVALAALATLTVSVEAQQARPSAPPAPPRPQILPPDNAPPPQNGEPRSSAYNVGVIGRGNNQAPVGYGYNPIPPAMMSSSPAVAQAGGQSNPYSMSTVPSYNPYLNINAGMSNSPYSLSTMPSPGGPAMIGGGFGGGFGWGFTPNSMGYGYALMGIADYTRASGQYWKDIQSARMGREQVSQMQIETARRRIQFEMWYETVRPTASKMRDTEMATDLDRARKDPPDSEIVSGRVLNTLLKSVQSTGRPGRGPNIPLEEDTLKHINLNGGTSAGNVGILRGGVNLNWPESLQEGGFDEPRKRLTRNLRTAVDTIKDREPIPPALRKDIQGDFKTINDKVSESADDMSPAQYIESRRFLNQLNSAIKALSDPKVGNYFNNTWNARGKNVGEMVENMTREGLTFAAATSGDEAAYRSLYQALRAYEAAMLSTQP
ncbi:MAG: hypothetical protein U0840_13840 [Gemmataceae bacterium]